MSSGCPTNTGLKKMKGLEPHPCMVHLVWITVYLCHSRSNEVCPLHSWLCGLRSSLRDALERFTKPTGCLYSWIDHKWGPAWGWRLCTVLRILQMCLLKYYHYWRWRTRTISRTTSNSSADRREENANEELLHCHHHYQCHHHYHCHCHCHCH